MTTALDSRYSWTRLGITLAIAAVGNAGMWTIILILPAVQAEFGVDRADASLPYAITMAGFAIGNVLMGRAVDRIGTTATVIAAALLLGAGFAAASLAPGIAALTAVQFVIGLASATFFGPLIADVSLWFLRRRGIAVALAASGNYVAGAIWPLILKSQVATGDWRGAYVAVALASVAIMVPLALLLRRKLPDEAADTADAIARARLFHVTWPARKLQFLLALAGFACCMAMAMPQVHIVALCADLGFGPAVGAEMLALSLAGGIVSRLVSGWLADRIGGLKVLLIGSALQTLALALYLPSDGLTSLYVVSLVFGLSQGGLVPSYAIIIREYLPARGAGARVGMVIMATIVGMAVGGWASGAIFDLTGSYAMAFLHGIAWNLVNLGIAALILFRGVGGRVMLARG